jgi:flagellar hook-length control protein FliK
MANALPGAPVLAAARSPADGSSTAADGGSSVTSSTGSSGLATMGSVSQWSAGADVGALRQRLDAAGVSILAGSDHGAGDQGDDSRSGPAGNAAPPALGDLVRSLPSAAIPMGPRDSSISVPVGSDGWPRAVAAQLHWFVSNGVQSATLRLVPDHLGPIDVHVDVQQSQVNVNFTAAHPDTRAALEQTVPRLREILAGSGLTLGHANVQQQPQPRAQTPASAARTAPAAAPSAEPVAVTASPLPGLVDEYA